MIFNELTLFFKTSWYAGEKQFWSIGG